MPRSQKTKTPDDNLAEAQLIDSTEQLPSRQKALVFISHDSRDGDLAEAFSNLLLDVSGGMLKSFCSSDKKGTSGIEYGEEWYSKIVSQLGNATAVVALLTQRSIDRPWILYEAGMAKGSLNTRVIGVALGVPFERVVTGPFGQFHNCSDDEDAQTKLVMQLLQQNPDASPREEAVRQQVRVFRGRVEKIIASRGKQPAQPTALPEDQSTAKLFEELKAMVRELPERVDKRLRSASRRPPLQPSRRLNPAMLEGLLYHPELQNTKDSTTISWLIMITMLKDDCPWIYEAGIELYRALRSGNGREIQRARRQMSDILRVTQRGSLFYDLMVDDKDTFYNLRHLHGLLDRVISGSWRRRPEPIISTPKPPKPSEEPETSP